MNLSGLSEDSDTSDDDYCPEEKTDEVLSEVDSDGDPEEPLSDNENSKAKSRKRARQTTKSKKRQKKSQQRPDEPASSSGDKATEITEEEKKKKDDDIWADFMKDTGFKSRGATASNPVKSPQKLEPVKGPFTQPVNKVTDKVKVTQIFEFAGEEVKIEKEVSADSAEARLLNPTPDSSSKNKGKSKGGLSGIGAVLNQLGKKPKISTLEKSKLDWDKFKKEENLEEELQTHNKGKDGYLERQDFLQRADLRRFEIEKEIRTIERNKRATNLI